MAQAPQGDVHKGMQGDHVLQRPQEAGAQD